MSGCRWLSYDLGGPCHAHGAARLNARTLADEQSLSKIVFSSSCDGWLPRRWSGSIQSPQLLEDSGYRVRRPKGATRIYWSGLF